MLKLAFVSGVAKALKDMGLIKLNQDVLDQLTEAVAAELPGTEEQYAEPMPEGVTAELAASLVELADSLQQSADAAALAAESAAAAEEQKNASWLLRKLSQTPNLNDTGSTAVGEGSNTLADAETGEAAMEEEQRPEGYANTGIGVQEHSGEGLLGAEIERTGEGGPVLADENSATATVEAKAALWRIREALRKHGVDTGATVAPGKDTPNAETGEGIVEKKQRPLGYAQVGLGKTQVSGGEVGQQQQHEKQEEHAGSSNEASKVSEEQEYIRQIRKLGQKYAHVLPFYLSDIEKIAALQYLAGISPTERAAVVRYIEKTGELPEGLREYVEKKKEEEAAKEEAPAEETKEKTESKNKEQEKKSALLRRLRRLSL